VDTGRNPKEVINGFRVIMKREKSTRYGFLVIGNGDIEETCLL
jgi:hypothetical protein